MNNYFTILKESYRMKEISVSVRSRRAWSNADNSGGISQKVVLVVDYVFDPIHKARNFSVNARKLGSGAAYSPADYATQVVSAI